MFERIPEGWMVDRLSNHYVNNGAIEWYCELVTYKPTECSAHAYAESPREAISEAIKAIGYEYPETLTKWEDMSKAEQHQHEIDLMLKYTQSTLELARELTTHSKKYLCMDEKDLAELMTAEQRAEYERMGKELAELH